jgi:hypothetical protein
LYIVLAYVVVYLETLRGVRSGLQRLSFLI